MNFSYDPIQDMRTHPILYTAAGVLAALLALLIAQRPEPTTPGSCAAQPDGQPGVTAPSWSGRSGGNQPGITDHGAR
ncbi:hypothetical protein [Nocardia thraciensis]